ncbi:GNAT family N-acetyltransferase [Streptomyces sp. JJ36]|nr:GNAT family N-acetyltransferase [Streptomyces sp. JJ36]
MTEADAAGVAAARVGGWRYAYAGIMPQAYLDALSVTADTERRRTMLRNGLPGARHLVSEDGGGAVTGWASYGPYRGKEHGPETHGDRGGPAAAGRGDPQDADGEVYALYVHPEAIGTGTGRALLTAVLEQAGALGCPGLRLWVVEGNARARRFYERAGFAPDGARQLFEVGGAPVPEVRYRRAL